MAFAWGGREENLGVPRTVVHHNFDHAIKRFMLTYQMPVGVAFQSKVSLAEYALNMVRDEIVQRGAAFRKRGGPLRSYATMPQLLPDLFHLA
jgi:hypothetical protein